MFEEQWKQRERERAIRDKIRNCLDLLNYHQSLHCDSEWIHLINCPSLVMQFSDGFLCLCRSEWSSSLFFRSGRGNFGVGHSNRRWAHLPPCGKKILSGALHSLWCMYVCLQRTLWRSGMRWSRQGCWRRWWKTFRRSCRRCWKGCRRECVTHHYMSKVRTPQTLAEIKKNKKYSNEYIKWNWLK